MKNASLLNMILENLFPSWPTIIIWSKTLIFDVYSEYYLRFIYGLELYNFIKH